MRRMAAKFVRIKSPLDTMHPLLSLAISCDMNFLFPFLKVDFSKLLLTSEVLCICSIQLCHCIAPNSRLHLSKDALEQHPSHGVTVSEHHFNQMTP
jgi:hypothetical protein